MALSSRGTDEWPPLFAVDIVKFAETFSAAPTELMNGLPSRSAPPPPSLSAYAASTRSLWFAMSQRTPFDPPPSSSAVRARIRSRSGL